MAAFKNIFSTPVTLVSELIEHIPRAMEEVLSNHGKTPKQERG